MRPIRHPRTTAAVAALGLLLVVPAAAAAPRRPAPVSCNLVSDPADVPNSPSLDVLSADVATNATKITSVIRVKSLANGNDPRVLAGRQWTFAYKVEGQPGSFRVQEGVTGATGGGATVALDRTKHEIRYTVPLKGLVPPIVPGKTVLTDFTVRTTGYVNPVLVAGFDVPGTGEWTTATSKTYKAGTKSCITVG